MLLFDANRGAKMRSKTQVHNENFANGASNSHNDNDDDTKYTNIYNIYRICEFMGWTLDIDTYHNNGYGNWAFYIFCTLTCIFS